MAARPLGLPGWGPRGRAKVADGNRTMRVTAEVIRLCERYCMPVAFESPRCSWLFAAPGHPAVPPAA
eukprot:877506-Lingulodinium_polyedra.AAC.1